MTAAIAAASVSMRAGASTLLDRVDFVAGAGETVAVVGPNGAGKSTLLRVLSGEIRPHRGAVSLRERLIGDYPPRILALNRAVLSQHVSIAFPFTVVEIVRMGAGNNVGASVEALVDAALEEVDLASFRERTISALSGGERQRAHIARILVQLAYGEAVIGPGVL